MRLAFRRIVLFALSFIVAGSVDAADDPVSRPDAVPYRPTVSTPAALSAPGWLEGEFGGLYLQDRQADAAQPHRGSLPYTFKYAFTDDWGVRVGGEAFVHGRDDDDARRNGFGDTGVVLKRRFAIDEDSAFGLEAGGLFPTARPGLRTGSGKPDWSVNGIYSADLGAWHTDVNLVNTRFGGRQAGTSRLQTLGAAALSHPLGTLWTVEGELSGTRQRGTPGTAQLLGALAWTVRHDLIVDVGTVRGLNRATPTWQAFTGVTVVLGRLD